MSDTFHSRADAIESELDDLLSPEELARIQARERTVQRFQVHVGGMSTEPDFAFFALADAESKARSVSREVNDSAVVIDDETGLHVAAFVGGKAVGLGNLNDHADRE